MLRSFLAFDLHADAEIALGKHPPQARQMRLAGKHNQHPGGPKLAQCTRQVHPQRYGADAARTSRQRDHGDVLRTRSIEQHTFGEHEARCCRRRAKRAQPPGDRRFALGGAGGNADSQEGAGLHAAYLRQNAGVNRTSTDISSRRPISIAKVQTQVWKSFSRA